MPNSDDEDRFHAYRPEDKMIVVPIHVPPKFVRRVKEIAGDRGMKYAEVYRQFIREGVERYDRKKQQGEKE